MEGTSDKRRRFCAAACVTLSAASIGSSHAPAASGGRATPAAAVATTAYQWPVRPFNAPHPIRGGFDDPRIGERNRNFHFGIDIVARDGASVYSVAPGVVYLRHANAVCIRTNSTQAFAYWHIVPLVDFGASVAAGQLIGYVAPGWGHVHFAEIENGYVVNPTRPGALGPIADHVPPTIAAIIASVHGADADLSNLRGTFDLIADVNDTGDLHPTGAWHDAVVTPALLKWRLERDGRPATPWTVAADFRTFRLSSGEFDSVYAPGTRQNVPGLAGRYLIYLARAFDSSRLRGDYRLRVSASDAEGNRTVRVVPVRFANDRP
jgi:Peptidase family M23